MIAWASRMVVGMAFTLAAASVVPAAVAATTSGSNANGSFTLSVADQQADPDGSTSVPVTLSWTGIPSVWRVVLDVDAIPMGSASTDGGAYEFVYDQSSGTLSDMVTVGSGAGTYTLRGTVTLDGDVEITTPVTTTFTVSPAPTAVDLAASVSPDSVTFRGRATTQSPTLGTVGAETAIRLQRWDGGKWVDFYDAVPDQFGNYTTTVYAWESAAAGLMGSRVRAVVAATATFAESVSNEVSLGPPPVAVSASAVSRSGKLRVDVDPDRGRGYWKFKVERQKASGAWKRVGTYRTKGSAETRTLNLRKGTYRVVVYAKYGYAGSTSAPVVLLR